MKARAFWLPLVGLSVFLVLNVANIAIADDDDPPVSVLGAEATVTVSPEAVTKSGIASARPSIVPWRKLVPAYGYVLNATQLITLVSDYADMKARLESMQAQQTLARAKLDRDKGLYRDRQNISQEQFQETTARFQSNSAMVKAEQVRVNNALNIIRQQFGSVISDATEKNTIFITQLLQQQVVLVKVTLPPDTDLPTPPSQADVTDYGNTGGHGTMLHYLSPVTMTDPALQGRSFFYFASAESQLVAGMNVSVLLPTEEERPGIRIPASAIIWLQGKSWIYRDNGHGKFTRRPLTTDVPDREGGYLIQDTPGQITHETQIVVEGTQLLLSEEFRAQLESGDDDD
ncbi:efflux RND transporter periplasmic adaptor subunit [Acetobacter cerevisiae]|uniref:Multidrug transporter n=1 Tax=Acetobacter cerevisiae TaxID=178900 RepID=A0A149QWK1_9PROT|nr:efflux RND transporter periplasmic adaptor subunit [Acetobacter cerevisiae]KXV01686.1 multidrug transporter [Acetobacter cerevisiae]GBQ07531.1 multidrug efflux membrane pump [Acetobacter cerevisiae DSM 14362]